MTSKQIREAEYSTPLIWLQEIAYQLALVNEANARWEELNRPPTRAEALAQADAVAAARKRRSSNA